MTVERHAYYFLVISNNNSKLIIYSSVKLSECSCVVYLLSLMSLFVWLQYGVQQGGCGPAPEQRL